MSSQREYSVLLDASGLECPMPLLKAKVALREMTAGSILKVISTDSGSVRDIPSYIKRTEHKLIEKQEDNSGLLYFWIEKGSKGAVNA